MQLRTPDVDEEVESVRVQQRSVTRQRAGAASDRQGAVGLLHRTAGNQAVQRAHEDEAAGSEIEVSQPGDREEREAERVATEVMEMSDPEPTVDTRDRTPPDGRQTEEGMCTRCRRRSRAGKPLHCPECEDAVQPKADGPAAATGDTAVQRRLRSLQGGGRPLPRSTRSFFEPRFGRAFDAVRVHTGGRADELARSVDARAVTVGNDIVFRSGTYRPGTRQGRRLLAHELTHVVQSRPAAVLSRQQQTGGAQQQRQQQQQGSSCDTTQRQQFEAARRTAAIRAQVAANRVSGIVPPVPGRDSAEAARTRAEMLARRLFDERPDMDGVAETVRRIRDVISTSSVPVDCAADSDSLCGSFQAYVVNSRPPIHLCPSFFDRGVDEQANILIHEAAHLVGIGEPEGESYCAVFDCQTSCGGFDVADSWAHYIHCLSGQPAQEPEQITGED